MFGPAARTRGNNHEPLLDSSTNKRATPFDYGSGHVQPNHAMNPGLVYDLSVDDYLNFLCYRGYNKSLVKIFSGKPHSCPKSYSIEDFNYPSITISNLGNKTVTVTRRVKNVGTAGTYKVSVKKPAGVSVSVHPKTLEFKERGEEKTFEVSFESKRKGGKELDYVFGRLTWSDGKHFVRSPVVVKRN